MNDFRFFKMYVGTCRFSSSRVRLRLEGVGSEDDPDCRNATSALESDHAAYNLILTGKP